MKRALGLILILTALFALGARAASVVGSLEPMALSVGDDTVYVGENNWIYLSDSDIPLVREAARSLVYADADALIYTTVDEKDLPDYPGAALLRLAHPDREDDSPSTLAEIAGEAIYVATDGAIYFARQGETAVSRYGAFTGKTEKVFSLQDAPRSMMETLDGLMVCTSGSRSVYLRGVNILTQVDEDVRTVICGGQFETELDGSGRLTLRPRGEKRGKETVIDENAVVCAQMDGAAYYLKKEGEVFNLMRWTFARGAERVKVMGAGLLPQLAAGGGYVYMIDQSRLIYRYDAETGVTEPFANVDKSVASPLLAAARQMLLVYEGASLAGSPEFAAKYTSDRARYDVSQAESAPQTISLSRGDRGDLVRAVQRVLIRHGYLSGRAEGIYGPSTQSAVKYIEYDLGLPQDGVISPALLRTLLDDENLPDFARCVLLNRGDKGIRVADLQRRLHALGYLAGEVDGMYGEATANAVKLFEKDAGLKQSGIATVTMQKRLFDKGAPSRATTPGDGEYKPQRDTPEKQYVSKGDIAPMVTWMNQHLVGSFNERSAVARLQKRLYKLGYLGTRHISRVYDELTWLAVKRYQEAELGGAPANGIAGPETLSPLFRAEE